MIPDPRSPLAIPLFRAVWLASTASHFGGLIQAVGAAWVMLALTNDPQQVALVQTAASVPIVALSLFAGAIADRRDRRHVMIVAQAFMLAVASALAAFAWFGALTPAIVLACTVLIGCGTAFHTPAWQASVGDLVPRAMIPAAVVTNGLGFNLSRTLGPAVGGVIVAGVGAAAGFVVNAVSYLGLIVVLVRWDPVHAGAPVVGGIGSAMMAGVRTVLASRTILIATIRAALFATMSSATLALMPVVARDLLGGQASLYGTLFSLFGIGSIAGSFVSRWAQARTSSERTVGLASLALAGAAIGIACNAGFVPTAVALLVAGGATVVALSTFTVVVQMAAPAGAVARSLSIYQAGTFAGIGAGGAVFGTIAARYGVAAALDAAAAFQIVAVLVGRRWPMADRR